MSGAPYRLPVPSGACPLCGELRVLVPPSGECVTSPPARGDALSAAMAAGPAATARATPPSGPPGRGAATPTSTAAWTTRWGVIARDRAGGLPTPQRVDLPHLRRSHRRRLPDLREVRRESPAVQRGARAPRPGRRCPRVPVPAAAAAADLGDAMSSPPEQQDPGQELLRQLFGALPVRRPRRGPRPAQAATGRPVPAPALHRAARGPGGLRQEPGRPDHRLRRSARRRRTLYLSGEVTHAEFNSRARHISETRDGELTDQAARAWLERVAFADAAEALPVIWGLQAAWKAVCADYALVVLDAVSDAGGALNLKFASDNDDWLAFWRGFAHPCQGRVALLLLDNIGHAEDSRTRALGASAKGHKVDIRLSSKKRDPSRSPSSSRRRRSAPSAPRSARAPAGSPTRPAAGRLASSTPGRSRRSRPPPRPRRGRRRRPRGAVAAGAGSSSSRRCARPASRAATRRSARAAEGDGRRPRPAACATPTGRGASSSLPNGPDSAMPRPMPQAYARAPSTDWGPGHRA